MQTTRVLRRVAAAWMIFGMVGAAWSADTPKAETIDLKFIENKDGATSWYGFAKDANGLCRGWQPFAGRQLVFQVIGDKVRADTNGDGKVDDKDDPAVKPEEPKGTQVYVPAKVAGKDVKYPLNIRMYDWGVIAGSAASLVGQFGDYTISIQDTDINGQLGSDSDQVRIQNKGQSGTSWPWSKALVFGRQIYQVEMLNDGAKLKLQPYTGPVAEVVIEAAESARNLQVRLVGTHREQAADCTAKETGLFIPGSYRIQSVQYQAGPENRPEHLWAYQDYSSRPLELKAGKNVVKVGPPLKLSFTAEMKGIILELEHVKITGLAGEMYRPNVRTDQKESFGIYVRSGGKETQIGKLEFG